MKKALVPMSLALLAMLTSCGQKESSSNIDPIKPSTTFTDPDEADKEGGSDEPIIVEGSPYTQEQLYFGNRVFGKDFLEANCTHVDKYTESRRVTEFAFSNESTTLTTVSPIVSAYENGRHTPFSLVSEDTFNAYSSDPVTRYKFDSYGGIAFVKDNKLNNGCYSLFDGFGNRIFDSIYSGYATSVSNEKKSGYLAHGEGDPCIPVDYARYQFRIGASSSNYQSYDKLAIYMGTKCIMVTDYSESAFCEYVGQHQTEDAEGIGLDKHPLDQYGKHDWYYTLNDGHYRFYNDQNKIVSAISTNYLNSESTFSTSWLSANHLNIQVTYKTDDKHDYTFEYDGSYYKTSHIVFEYTSGKTYSVKDLNYIVFHTTDMKYSNAYYDISLANIRFISNKRLLEYTYSFLLDKDLVLRDDVTNLISPTIVKTENYYYSEVNFKYNIFDAATGGQTLSVPTGKVAQFYPRSEMFSLKVDTNRYGLVGFNGKYLFDAKYSSFGDPQYFDGYRYITGVDYQNSNHYLLDLVEQRRTKLASISDEVNAVSRGILFVKTSSSLKLVDLFTGEAAWERSASTVSKDPNFKQSFNNGLFDFTLLHFLSSDKQIIVKIGEKFTPINNQQ